MSRIRLSPTTVTPRAETCCPMPEKLEAVRNAGIDQCPDDDQEDEDRDQCRLADQRERGGAAAAALQHLLDLCPAALGDLGRRFGGAGGIAAPDVSHAAGPCPSDSVCCCCVLPSLPVPSVAAISASGVKRRRAELGEPLATDQDHDPVADVQVGELVAGEQQAGAALLGHRGELGEQQRLRRHVHPAGGRDRDDQPRLARDRAGDGDLLLVAPGQLADRLVPGRRTRSTGCEPAAPSRRTRARGRSQPSRRASQSTIDIVPFSATPSSATKPSAWRSSGM